MKKLSILLFFFAVASGVNAQSNFLLYSFKGNVSVVENGAESKAKVGRLLNSTATIKVASGGAVTMICNEAAMFTLTKAGTYQLSSFGDSCKSSGGSVSSNYVKYVWASMTKSTSNPGSNRKAYMNTVGAVKRNINNVWIDVRLDTINYTGGDFPLSWKSYEEAKLFDFWLYTNDNLAEPMYKTSLSKLKIPITDFSAKLIVGKSYFWTASINGEENEELKVLNYMSKEALDKQIATFKAMGAAYEAPAEQAYRLAFLLEDAHYLSEAYQYYTKAAQLDNANVLYRSTLMSFKKDYEIK